MLGGTFLWRAGLDLKRKKMNHNERGRTNERGVAGRIYIDILTEAKGKATTEKRKLMPIDIRSTTNQMTKQPGPQHNNNNINYIT